MNVRAVSTIAACAILISSCSDESLRPLSPALGVPSTPAADVSTVPTVYTSGDSPVTTYDPIFPAAADPTWETTSCTTVPAVGLNANWQAPHAAYDIGYHPWLNSLFAAKWINAWDDNASRGPELPGRAGSGQSWTKYTTPINGVGTYVLRLLADNCSWVYVDNQLVGVQPASWNDQNTTYSVSLDGNPHTLTFLIFDGGGLAGGKFRMETYDSYIAGGGNPNFISKTPTATTVSFGSGPFVYKGSAYTATATVSTGATATIVYSGDCTNAGGTCTATATYAGDATHAGSSATATITIANKAVTTTTVGFGAGPFVYTGSAFTATASVSPTGTATIVYSGDCISAGTSCTATATYAGDGNYAGSTATANITIAKAASSTTVTFGTGPFIYTGSAFTASASVSPAAAGTATIAYSGDCIYAGNTCTATASFAGSGNYLSSSKSTSIAIKYPVATSAVQCKDGGWRYSTDDLGNLFKNQGDCVSYVATRLRNKAAGPPAP